MRNRSLYNYITMKLYASGLIKKSVLIKKSLTAFLLVFFLVSGGNHITAKAETYEYAQVVTDDCAFYSDASLKFVKFILPYSYYVKIISVGAETSRVIYLDDDFSCPPAEGYVKNVCLNFTLTPESALYPKTLVSLKTDEVIFGDLSLKTPKAVISAGSQAKFYGEIKTEGVNYLYVFVNGYVGYIRKDGFFSYVLPVNEISLTIENEDNDEQSFSITEDNDTKQKFKTSEVIIVAVIIIVGLTLIVFALKPNSKKSYKQFDDD